MPANKNAPVYLFKSSSVISFALLDLLNTTGAGIAASKPNTVADSISPLRPVLN